MIHSFEFSSIQARVLAWYFRGLGSQRTLDYHVEDINVVVDLACDDYISAKRTLYNYVKKPIVE